MDTVCRKGVEQEEGVELLRWKIILPVDRDDAEFSSVCERLASSATEFCRGELRRRLAERYQASEDVKKRFRFPAYRYTLEGTVTQTDESVTSVLWTAELKTGARTCAKGSVGLVWSRKESVFLSLRQTAKLKNCPLPHLAGRQEIGSFFLRDSELWIRRGEDWVLSKIRDEKRAGTNAS